MPFIRMMRTRVNANLAYSLRLQNDAFLPHTINPAISSPGLALPQDSLDGMVGTLLLNVYASSRPLRPLTLSFKYRFYDFNDMSDTPLFPAHVVNDRTLVVDALTAQHGLRIAAREAAPYDVGQLVDQLALFGLIEMLVFLFILVVGYFYAWKKGALEWQL